MIADNLIEIASYADPIEASIARASLEAANIPVFMTDEHTINTAWFYANALGGIRLHVPREYELEAKNLLSQDFSDDLENTLDDNLKSEHETCPVCGSENIIPYTRGKKPAFIVFILLGFPLFFYSRGMKCNDCGEFNRK